MSFSTSAIRGLGLDVGKGLIFLIGAKTKTKVGVEKGRENGVGQDT